jgi:hypothetical protein
VKRLVESGCGPDLPLLLNAQPCRSEQDAGNLKPVRTLACVIGKTLLCVQHYFMPETEMVTTQKIHQSVGLRECV